MRLRDKISFNYLFPLSYSFTLWAFLIVSAIVSGILFAHFLVYDVTKEALYGRNMFDHTETSKRASDIKSRLLFSSKCFPLFYIHILLILCPCLELFSKKIFMFFLSLNSFCRAHQISDIFYPNVASFNVICNQV